MGIDLTIVNRCTNAPMCAWPPATPSGRAAWPLPSSTLGGARLCRRLKAAGLRLRGRGPLGPSTRRAAGRWLRRFSAVLCRPRQPAACGPGASGRGSRGAALCPRARLKAFSANACSRPWTGPKPAWRDRPGHRPGRLPRRLRLIPSAKLARLLPYICI